MVNTGLPLTGCYEPELACSLQVTLHRSGVTEHNHVQTIQGEGMPRYDESGYGDLSVTYSVNFPTELSEAQRDIIKQYF